jgi:hypothetical protein
LIPSALIELALIIEATVSSDCPSVIITITSDVKLLGDAMKIPFAYDSASARFVEPPMN